MILIGRGLDLEETDGKVRVSKGSEGGHGQSAKATRTCAVLRVRSRSCEDGKKRLSATKVSREAVRHRRQQSAWPTRRQQGARQQLALGPAQFPVTIA